MDPVARTKRKRAQSTTTVSNLDVVERLTSLGYTLLRPRAVGESPARGTVPDDEGDSKEEGRSMSQISEPVQGGGRDGHMDGGDSSEGDEDRSLWEWRETSPTLERSARPVSRSGCVTGSSGSSQLSRPLARTSSFVPSTPTIRTPSLSPSISTANKDLSGTRLSLADLNNILVAHKTMVTSQLLKSKGGAVELSSEANDENFETRCDTPAQGPFADAPVSITPTRSQSSPSRLSQPLQTAIRALVLPSLFRGTVNGTRSMRERLGWIISAATRISKDPANVEGRDARFIGQEITRMVVGRSIEWWRVNFNVFSDERELILATRTSFRPFLTDSPGDDPPLPFWFAHVQHFQLCRNSSATCPFHIALVIHHAYRGQGDLIQKRRKVPTSDDLDVRGVKDEWKEFARYYIAIAGENEWEVDIATMYLRRGRKGSSVSRQGTVLRWKARLIFTLLRSLLLPLALASDSLLSTATRLQSIWPSLTFEQTLQLGNTLVSMSPLLQLSDYRRGDSPKIELRAVNNLVFHRPSGPFGSSSEAINWSLGGGEGLLVAAQALGLLRSESHPSFPVSPSRPPLRVICSHRNICTQCGTALRAPSRKKPREIWILSSSKVERGEYVKLVCSNDGCKATHYPDRVNITHGDVCIDSFDVDAEWIKIGRESWAGRDFVKTFVGHLESSHVAVSSYAGTYTRLYQPEEEWELAPDQLWYAYVLHSTLLLAKEVDRPVVTLARAPSTEIVQLALENFLTSKRVPGGLEHSCPDCSRYARTWNGGPAGEDESVQYKKGIEKHLEEHTTVDESRIIKLAVLDGIKIGHRTCAYTTCTNDPLDFKSARFCSVHLEYLDLCGVFGCGEPLIEVEDDQPPSGACMDEDHQAMWRRHSLKKGRHNVGGYQRMISRHETHTEDKEEHIYAEDEEDNGDEDTSSSSTMWSFGRKSQVQLLVGACGTIIGWEKFSPDEDVRDLLAFLETISNGSTKDLPSIIAYDRACKVLGVVASDPKLLHWLDDVKFIVDSFHYVGHSKKDALCRTFCDPAPMDGSAPDLVTPFVEIEVPGSRRKSKGRSKRLFRRAFNTEAAEQFNSWLIGFAPTLRGMTSANHSFLLHLLMRGRFASQSNIIAKKHKGVLVG